ncbi:fasciclin domain-containing protein [Flavobacterium sp. MAH-1]|uniref:Fasciclin domain-containing protein n=1 Tax=Flavobacterium agri TaxID=2743471 RepID=A0A7Y9C6P6_9FLAO|nr:fasciclin domain-containing protein [Flavobacterium agri]NUY80447.1 fasciclin domain-containing protein [Flavobacterium agri]NYA70472.1 fasciclin domain-containing protein [Flavobacterium agri]
MKTQLKKIAMLCLAVCAWSCSSDDDGSNNSGQTIAEIASANANLSVLVDALDRADLVATLDGNTQYTVFAPTNAAFNAFLQANGYANVDAVPVAALKEILLNHVISGETTSSQLATGYVKTLAKGSASTTNTLSMYINTSSGVVINGGTANGGATVTTADVQASNGVIHIVDGVIGLPTVVNHAVANANFSVLVQALTRDDQPDFVGILSGSANSPFTVFAPTNTAFASLLTELSLAGLNDIPQATLEKTLKYHVVTNANVLSSALTDGMMVDTFAGDSFTIGLTGGPKITDFNGRVSNITVTDVQASNGVIHVIDKVLLPSL